MVAGFGSSISIGAGEKSTFFSIFGESAGACFLSSVSSSDGVTESVGAGVSTVNWLGICTGWIGTARGKTWVSVVSILFGRGACLL